MRRHVVASWFLAVATVAWSTVLAQQSTTTPSTPSEPIAGVIDAFRTHAIVALGEGDHNNEQGHAFRLALLHDRRFAEVVNDIVVESGNAYYQNVMDRFVNGDDVSSTELRQAWQNTTQLRPVWDVPIYEQFFRAVREVNMSLSVDRRLRVLLGDPPIDWSRVSGFSDVFAQMREVGDRDTHPAKLIQHDVLDKGRRALVIYGDQHLTRTPEALRPGCQPGSTIPCFPGSIVDQVERSSGTRAFTVTTVTGADLRTMQSDIATWRRPSLTILRGTILGGQSFRSFLPPGPLMIGRDGRPQPESPSVLRPIEDVFDAALYVGPPSTLTYAHLSPDLCADSAYVRMRRERMAMAPAAQGPSICEP
jgi:hypothetical protein